MIDGPTDQFIPRCGCEDVPFVRPGTVPYNSRMRLISCYGYETVWCNSIQLRSRDQDDDGLPPASFKEDSLHERSRETETTYLSSGLNATLVTVNVCPDNGVPNCCHLSVSYILTTACSGDVALQAVATNFRLVDTARVID